METVFWVSFGSSLYVYVGLSRCCSRHGHGVRRGASGECRRRRLPARLDRDRRTQRGRTAARTDREPAGARLPRRSAGDRRRVRRLDRLHARCHGPVRRLSERAGAPRIELVEVGPHGKAAALNAGVCRGTPRRAGLRRCTAALRARRGAAPGCELRRSHGRRGVGRARARLRGGRERVQRRRRRGRVLAVREVAARPRERHRLDARRHRRDLRDAPGVLAAAAGRHHSGRRAGADARGARGLSSRLRADGAGVSTSRRPTPPRNRAARLEPSRATTRCSPSNRGCSSRS